MVGSRTWPRNGPGRIGRAQWSRIPTEDARHWANNGLCDRQDQWRRRTPSPSLLAWMIKRPAWPRSSPQRPTEQATKAHGERPSRCLVLGWRADFRSFPLFRSSGHEQIFSGSLMFLESWHRRKTPGPAIFNLFCGHALAVPTKVAASGRLDRPAWALGRAVVRLIGQWSDQPNSSWQDRQTARPCHSARRARHLR
jgi:hypothetical protein